MGIGGKDETAFSFEGDWTEIAPIVFTNLLLSIVTLGIYRFWGATRVRQYLWSRTRFIDENLAWTGTGMELFVGFIIAVLLIFLPLVGLNFLVQALFLQGYAAAALAIGAGLYVVLFYLVGVAVLRGLRYRLSRTEWRGIRGGSNAQGLGYGLSYLWKTVAGGLALGLLVPWSMTSLWAQRWNTMSFGPHPFVSTPKWEGLMGRYLLCYVGPLLVLVGGLLFIFNDNRLSGAVSAGPDFFIIFMILVFVGSYFILPLLALAYYAAFFREAIGTLSLSTLDFHFTARGRDWVLLAVTNILLVIFTLGLGALFVSYRNWKFFIQHLEASGEVSIDSLSQSTAAPVSQGEGLLDAFDIGAI